jgi:HEAT repeat protein
MDLDPSLESLVLTVHVLYQKGERPAAYRLLQEEMAKRPADNDLRALYASFLMDDQNFRDAEKEFRQVLAADPDNVAARESLLALLVNTGRPDEAVAECREAARRAPKDARIRILLRDLLASRGDYAGAAGAVEEALKLDLTPETRKRVEADLLALREAAAAPKERRALEPDEVLRRLDSPDALQRREAMQMLWEMDLGGLPPAVVRRVTDADETVRLFAVRLLGKYGDARAAGLLEVLLFHPKDHDASSAVRAQAAAALGRIGTPASLPVLFRGLEDADADVLRSSVQGIAGITGKAFVDDVLAPIPEKDRTAVREKYRLWWTSDPTGRLWRRKTCEAVGTSRAQALAWYLLPWIEEEDAALRGEVLAAMAEVTKDEAWRGAKSDTPEERKALVERARAALLGRK